MKTWLNISFFILFLGNLEGFSQNNNSTYVNPFIGTGGHGHTFPGAVLPFGMVQLSPDTRINGSWDGCSGYHYSDSLIYGFSHTHLSGTGVSDWGDILLMPSSEMPTMDHKVYASAFSHRNEKASPGYYEVELSKDKIQASLTTTLRTGIHRYSFQKNKNQLVVLDLLHRDKTLDCDFKILDSVTLSGYRFSEAWARDQRVYFVMKFSKPFKKVTYAQRKQLKNSGDYSPNEKTEGGIFEFDQRNSNVLMIKVAISGVSEQGALKNLLAEATHWDFEKYRQEAENAWNRELKKVEVTDPDKNKMTIFYSALYHCFIHPSLNMDVDGQYRGLDKQVHRAEGFTNYSVFSLWDTYRSLNPLFTILQPARTKDLINTFLAQYKQSGRLPVWELSGNETDCMIGFHSVSVIADAMTKGIGGFDTLLAFEAIKAASNYTGYAIPVFNKNGFLQVDDESESVSKSLEYGYDNWCIARVAQRLGKKDEEGLYFRRAQAFRNLFDDSTGFMRPRKNGNWLSPFSASEINNHFTEGNSWQYSFYVPHDVNGLIGLHGGKINFEKKLDELFSTSEKTSGREQADVTGLIGQYAHGNEPSHHMAYLYNYAGHPQKTVARVHQVCNDFYKNTPYGLIGNEDCGQMSAWYVFSAMGMYPVCPGSEEYVLGAPIFNEIKLALENGKTFLITSKPLGNQSLTGVSVNNKNFLRSALPHHLITQGGSINFLYGETKDPAKDKPVFRMNKYGEGLYGVFSRRNVYPQIIPAPLIRSKAQVFKEEILVLVTPSGKGAVECSYTTDGSEPTRNSAKGTKPFLITSNCTIKARAFSANDSSAVSTAVFYKIRYDYHLQMNSKPNPQYAVEGTQSLIDGIYGSANWQKGSWLGFQGQNFECLVDLKASRKISRLSLNALQDTRSWIAFPTEVTFYGSADNKTFEAIETFSAPVLLSELDPKVFKFESRLGISSKRSYRYLKIVAKNYGRLPEWHQGSGGEAFIFVDEIEIE